MKKILATVLTLCTALTLLTGCGGPKLGPDESVKAIYDLYILQETDGASKLGLTDADIKTALDTYDTALKSTIKANISSTGYELADEKLTEICDARKEAMKKMKADVEVVSKDKKTAEVKLSTTYFDEGTLDTNAVDEATAEADASGITDYDEYIDFAMNAYVENLIEAYKNVTPSEDKKAITVNCSVQENTWLPTDMTGFGTNLGAAVSGQ